MSGSSVRVLFVSRRNTARGILAESCLNHLGGGRFTAASCGMPAEVGRVHLPAAVQALRTAGLPLPEGRPQSWESLTRMGARRMDFVVLLDLVAATQAPAWPGQPATATWLFEDPVMAIACGSDPQETLRNLLHAVRRRVELLAALPMRGVNRSDLLHDVRDIGVS